MPNNSQKEAVAFIALVAPAPPPAQREECGEREDAEEEAFHGWEMALIARSL